MYWLGLICSHGSGIAWRRYALHRVPFQFIDRFIYNLKPGTILVHRGLFLHPLWQWTCFMHCQLFFCMQGYEDWLRHLADRKVNNALVLTVKNGHLVQTRSCNIKVRVSDNKQTSLIFQSVSCMKSREATTVEGFKLNVLYSWINSWCTLD